MYDEYINENGSPAEKPEDAVFDILWHAHSQYLQVNAKPYTPFDRSEVKITNQFFVEYHDIKFFLRLFEDKF